MPQNILLSAPIVLLFLFLALRCFAGWGVPVRLPLGQASPAEGSGEDGSRVSPVRRELLKIFLWALGLRLLLLLAVIACTMLAGGSWEELPSKFQMWDARHYGNLVDLGYANHQENGEHLFLVFYPLYVWVTRLVRLVVPNTIAAGVTVSVLSYSLGCCWVYRLAADQWNKSVAENAVLLLSLFPFSFFFGTVMTEGLFLLTTAAACYYAMKRKWLSYGIWGALAALTRMTGVLVIVPAVIELLNSLGPLRPPMGESLKRSWKKLLLSLPLLAMPLLGFLAYLGLNWYVDGSPFAFAVHQEHWSQGGMWISQVLGYIWYYLGNYIGEPMGWAVWLPTLVLFVVFFVTLALSAFRRENPPSLLVYGFCYLVANYSLSWLLSAGRYLSCGFVFFIFAAALLERFPRLRGLVLGVEAVFLGIYLYAYTCGAQIM
ncbi:hypothetical protein D7X94_03020 [Acutalibacter sp. 1XD8-33]|uniref:glycosyltransferase family 39 protein n=1 Tax=Acutalibacter sp. 1XD8-33 TaxID=2320081 RepID=UPI000EA05166|nr:glycosyltransferase family 39 protein [Acutalibacter sp. 1XD8-33]RKJ41800.1 hypothetical protein D7X94_03020 [Acutalibacter sp. 1XD8-33]